MLIKNLLVVGLITLASSVASSPQVPCNADNPCIWVPRESQGNVVLDANWQSCRNNEGVWGELAYDHHYFDPNTHHSRCDWSLHLGPHHDFALFRCGVDLDGPDDHDSPSNLLGRDHEVVASNWRGRGHWVVKRFNIKVDASDGWRL